MANKVPKGKRFQKGTSGNPKGRPRKILTILKESGYTKQDVLHVFREIGWTDRNQINKILKDEKSPMIVQLIARTFVRAIQSSDYRLVSEIMQYTLGTPQQQIKVEHEGKVEITHQKMIIDGKTYEL